MSENAGKPQVPTVLIADDDENIRLLVKSCLKERARVVGAADGQKAVLETIKCQPDLVLLDVIMPVKDGLAVCEELKLNPRTNHIPVVMVSGVDSESNRFLASTSGSAGYMMKPFNASDLLTLVERFLTQRPE
jgi:DNA-binding response OmpR family regulator